ncbi:MAG: hypothetical protein ACFFCZ_12775 [Promethearchaeota archaeon]
MVQVFSHFCKLFLTPKGDNVIELQHYKEVLTAFEEALKIRLQDADI